MRIWIFTDIKCEKVALSLRMGQYGYLQIFTVNQLQDPPQRGKCVEEFNSPQQMGRLEYSHIFNVKELHRLENIDI